MKMEQIEYSETSAAYNIHTPGNYPEENEKKENKFNLLAFPTFMTV
jgi:hypothetical protein